MKKNLYGLTVHVSFDTLRGLVSKCLPGPILEPEHISVISVEPGQIQHYDLCMDGMRLGTVRIERIDEYIQDLSIISPPAPPSRDWTDEEKALLSQQPDPGVRREMVIATTKAIQKERDEQRQRVLRTYQLVKASFLQRLTSELDWRRGQGLDRQSSELRKPGTSPAKPAKGASRYDWYEYKYQTDRRGLKLVTHEDIATEIGLDAGTVRNEYPKWKKRREQGEQP